VRRIGVIRGAEIEHVTMFNRGPNATGGSARDVIIRPRSEALNAGYMRLNMYPSTFRLYHDDHAFTKDSNSIEQSYVGTVNAI
jgi:hypothetical protein